MAVSSYSGLTLLNPTTGIKITKTTDTPSDWSSVANNTYFYDKQYELPFYKSNEGVVVNPFSNPLFDYVLYKQLSSITIANTVAETSVLTGGITLPANFFTAGKMLQIDLRGFHTASGNPNITIKVKIGSTVLLSTGAVASGNGTNLGIEIESDITCRTEGVSGTISGQGEYLEFMSTPNILSMVMTSPIVVNTNNSYVLDVTAQWGTASAGNTMTISDGTIRVL